MVNLVAVVLLWVLSRLRASSRNIVVLVGALCCLSQHTYADAIPVELIRSESGYQLLRNGEPYFIKGAGGDHSLEQLAAAGANSIRTWDAKNIRPLLDQAHALGLSVTVGIWLGHERHGFDYNNPTLVKEQLERARSYVLEYKDHPAVLIWGIGNEMEGYANGDNEKIWQTVNDIAAMIKKIDPAHPTMTVTAEVGGARVDYVHKKSPSIDIHGINSYGGASSLRQRLHRLEASKPYILTEFGPPGSWEVGKSSWGAPYESTSTEKAALYRRHYQLAVADAPGQALGAYVFIWGSKMEATATWFGMFLNDGSRLGAIDTMTQIWSGESAANLAPLVEPLSISGPTSLKQNQKVSVTAAITDPEGRQVRARWVLQPESGDPITGGDFRPQLPELNDTVIKAGIEGATIRMPKEPGPYRLFLYAYDDVGNAATANIPLLVEGEFRVPLPVIVYEDSFEGIPWAPSGWMGNTEHLTLRGDYGENAHSGKASIKLRYEGQYGWVGVAWQHPPSNWGDQEGGHDLTGAKFLEVWARGEYGGERIGLGVGIIGADKKYADSGITKVDGIVLNREWRRYRVPLKSIDLSSLKTGFVIVVSGRQTAVTVYLDSIRFTK